MGKAPIAVFYDTRESLPGFANAAITAASQVADTYVIKPRGRQPDKLGGATVVDLRDLPLGLEDVRAFRSQYLHLSTAPYEYEAASLERFLAVRSLCRVLGLAGVWHLDTDVLAGEHLRQANEEVERAGVSVVFSGEEAVEYKYGNPASLGNGYVALEVLDTYRTLLLDEFYGPLKSTNHAYFEQLASAGQMGGVCDMTAWGYLLSREPHLRRRNTNQSLIGGSMIINSLYALKQTLSAEAFSGAVNLSSPNRVCVERRGQALWLDADGSTVPIALLHLSGADKDLIPYLASSARLKVEGANHHLRRSWFRARRKVMSFKR